MKTIWLSTVFALSLAACGGASEPAAQTLEASQALQSELPNLSGDHVWNMLEADSIVSFEAFYNGSFTGTFSVFQTAIALNPEAPEGGGIHAIIDLASVSVKDDDVKANLPTADWFDVAVHPYARFSSTNITAIGGENYRAEGTLTIKGITKPANLTFALEITGDTAHATGGVEISRADFNVGTGPDFESEDWVKFPVNIKVDIKATR